MEKLDQYLRMGVAGEGTYGIVYKAQDKITGKLVALKKIKLCEPNKEQYEGIPSTALREISLLKALKHSSVIDLLDVIGTSTNLYLIFEYLDIDLKKYIDRMKTDMSEDLLKSYSKQLLEGVSYLHTHRILHRDLKPQNILLDKEGHIKIADFGLSRSCSFPNRILTVEVVTLWYRPPELLLGAKLYCPGVDMWSVACIIAEMILREALFPGDSEIDQLYKIFRVLGTPTEEIWEGCTQLPYYKMHFPQWDRQEISKIIPNGSPEAQSFLNEILVYNPLKRFSARSKLKEPFLKDVKLTSPDLECFPGALEN